MVLFRIISIALFLCVVNFVRIKECKTLEHTIEQNNGLKYLRSIKADKIIFDTDIGSDDAVAISFALEYIKKTNETTVVAISCTHGNTDLINVQNNTLKLLKTTDRLDIPVYAGMDRSFLTTPSGDHYYGMDGLNDFDFPDPPSMNLIKKEHAVNALIRLVKENPKEITLIAIGPLSNVAMAIRLDPSFRSNLKNLLMFSGSVDGYGNVGADLEFNSKMDAEATFVVFNSTEEGISPLIVFPWDTQVKSVGIPMKWRQKVLGMIQSSLMDFLNKAENIEKTTETKWYTADLSVVFTMYFPGWVTETEFVHVAPDTCGDFRGGLVVDRSNVLKRNKNAIIVKDVDLEFYMDLILNTFS